MTGGGLRRRLAGLLRGAARRFDPTVPAGPSAADGTIDPTAVIHPTGRLQLQGRAPSDIRVGPHSHIRGELLLFGHGGRIRIGAYCYVGEQTRIWSALSIDIGDRVLISHLVTIVDNLTHPLDAGARHAQFRAIVTGGHPTAIDLGERAVVIGDDAWIGAHAVILRGVTIGSGAIIGAGSVVTKDVEPNTLVAGNPARLVRRLATP